MAFARSLIAGTSYILSDDPALDPDASKHDQFMKDFDADKHLVLKEGCTPARWRLASLSRAQFLRVWSQSSPAERCYEAIAYGLREVSDFSVDGQPLRIETRKADLGRRLTDDCLDK